MGCKSPHGQTDLLVSTGGSPGLGRGVDLGQVAKGSLEVCRLNSSGSTGQCGNAVQPIDICAPGVQTDCRATVNRNKRLPSCCWGVWRSREKPGKSPRPHLVHLANEHLACSHTFPHPVARTQASLHQEGPTAAEDAPATCVRLRSCPLPQVSWPGFLPRAAPEAHPSLLKPLVPGGLLGKRDNGTIMCSWKALRMQQ